MKTPCDNGNRRYRLPAGIGRCGDASQHGTQWSVCDLLCAGSRRKPKWTDDRRNLYHRWIQCDWKTFAEYFPDHGGRLHCEYRPGVGYHESVGTSGAALSTTLAPIAGEFGILCGVLAGFLHASVALNVGICMGHEPL